MSDGRSIDTHISFDVLLWNCLPICVHKHRAEGFLSRFASLSIPLSPFHSQSLFPSTFNSVGALFSLSIKNPTRAASSNAMYYIPMSLLPPCSFVVYRVVLRTFEKTSLRFFILNRTVIRRCDRSCLFLVDNTLYVCYYGNYKVKFVIKNAGLFTFSVYII